VKRSSKIAVFMAAAATVAAVVLMPGGADALTTGHTGSGRPGLAVAGGRLYLGWTGSTSYPTGYELDLAWSVDGGKTMMKIAQSERVPVGEGPALDADNTSGGIYIAWSAQNNGNTLTAEYYSSTALSCRTAFTGVTTTHSPALVTDASGIRYIAWTDTASHLNVARLNSSACATTHTMTLTNRITLPDTSTAGPALVYDSSGSSDLGTLIAWTNAAHVVTVATYNGTTTLTGRSTVTSPVGAVGAPGLGVAVADLYVGYVGTDGNVYWGYSEGCIPTCFYPTTTGETGISGYGLSTGNSDFYGGLFDPTAHLIINRE
jgi:hypothetical protein